MRAKTLLAAYREISRENTLRFELAMRSLSSEIREEVRLQRDEGRVHREESRMYFEALHAQAEEEARRTDELIAESRAQRQALLSILDRMSGSGGGAAPAT